MYRISLTLFMLSLCLSCYADEAWKGPISLWPTQDGTTIYVVNKDAHEIAVLNTVEDKIVKTIPLGNGFFPQSAVLCADEKTLYVTGGGYKGQVKAVDLASGTITQTVAAGHTPTASVLTPDGSKLFVCNQFSNDVSEYRLPDLTLTRTIKAVREPRTAVVTKDGKFLLAANSIPLMPCNFLEKKDEDIYVFSELTVFNIASGETRSLPLPSGSGSLHGMCITPDGRYVYITEVNARFHAPTTQVERGWMNTAAIAVIDTAQLESESGGYVNTVLIDDVDQGAANPWGITTSADGTQIYVAVAGTSELLVVNAVEMHNRLNADAERRKSPNYRGTEVLNNLSFLVGLKRRIKLPGKGARAVAVAGNNIYVGMYFSDTLQKLDETRLRPVEIALGPAPNWTPQRRGEIYWNDATLCLQDWQSCASCHPDARIDAYNWDLLNDGQGNPKNTKSLLLSHKTTPSMWEGVRDNKERNNWDTETMGIECIRTGFQHILFVEPDEAISRDIDAYLTALQPVPSPYLVDGQLSEKAQRGQKIFEDPKVGCATCHPASNYFTDQKMHDVNSRSYFDMTSRFDTPSLIECWRTAPYLHDGRFVDMKDVFKIGLHGDVAGDVGGLTDEQLDELVEYVLSL